ncbi:hypothetical protein GQ600_6634 [Phytophthora cactorum]|nr:hypothetical protein GQ600_6634 [Phytophthora cactorum]
MKDIPVDGEVARTASLLADAKASTKDIGVLLSRQLGSLVATGPSGRGIPVLDFMAVNEKAKTLKVIFDGECWAASGDTATLTSEEAVLTECGTKANSDVHLSNEPLNTRNQPNTCEEMDSQRRTVAVIRLHREQRGALPILSSREKYNYAASCFQPGFSYLQIWEAPDSYRNPGEDSDTVSMIDPADLSAMLQDVTTWTAPSEISGADDLDPSSLMKDVFGISSRCSSPTTSPKYTKSASVADLTSDSPVSLPPPCDKTGSTATESTRLSDPSLPFTEPSGEVWAVVEWM